MNAVAPLVDFQPAYFQIDGMERAFVDGYVADIERHAAKNGQRLLAVLRSYSPGDLDQRSLTLLARPLVRAAIADRVREIADLADVSTYRTLKEVTAIAYANMGNYMSVNEYGEPEVDLSKCTPEQLTAIQSFEVEWSPRGGKKIKFKLHDKIAGLRMVMDYQGLLNSGEAWREAQKADNGKAGTLPAGVDDDQAAELYAREING